MTRGLLGRLLLAGLTLLLASVASGCSREVTAPPPDTATQTPPSAETTAPVQSELTVGTTEGPYYITGTSQLEDGNLNPDNLAGVPIRLSGVVYGGAGNETPIPGAKIEIWHADTDGAYHPQAGGAASDFSAEDLQLRGYVLTDSEGRYEFTTIYPGPYGGRTRHIHVRVSAERYGGVATQIIVPAREGDSTTPVDDAIAKSLPDSYQVQFTLNDEVLETTFDFHLGAD